MENFLFYFLFYLWFIAIELKEALKIIAQNHIQLDVLTPAMQNQDWVHIQTHGWTNGGGRMILEFYPLLKFRCFSNRNGTAVVQPNYIERARI